jgi:hypothetical protein
MIRNRLVVDECDVICPKLVEYGSMLGRLNWELWFSEIVIWLIKWGLQTLRQLSPFTVISASLLTWYQIGGNDAKTRIHEFRGRRPGGAGQRRTGGSGASTSAEHRLHHGRRSGVL